jgi:hypothetical protein
MVDPYRLLWLIQLQHIMTSMVTEYINQLQCLPAVSDKVDNLTSVILQRDQENGSSEDIS